MLAHLIQASPDQGFLLDSLSWSDQAGNLVDLFVGLALACLLTFALVQTYRATHRGATYSASFLQGLFILTACTTLIMVVIGSNVARAFSLVGALSIVRFRTAIKDPRDVGFIFAAVALGMGCGTGFYMQSILFTLFLCALLLGLSRLNVGRAESNEAIVRVTVAAPGSNGRGVTGAGGNAAVETVEAALRSAAVQPVLINRVLEGSSGLQTLSWRVRAGNSEAQGQLQERLRSIDGVTSVGLFVMDDFHVL